MVQIKLSKILTCTTELASRFVRYRFSRAIQRGIPSSGNEFSYSIILRQTVVGSGD